MRRRGERVTIPRPYYSEQEQENFKRATGHYYYYPRECHKCGNDFVPISDKEYICENCIRREAKEKINDRKS